MGMRLSDPRWFRDAAQIEHRILISLSTHQELVARKDRLEFVLMHSFLTVESVMELNRIREAEQAIWFEQSRVRLRCPICGGWARYGIEWFHFVPRCHDCGWPDHLHVPNPRTCYKLTLPEGGRF